MIATSCSRSVQHREHLAEPARTHRARRDGSCDPPAAASTATDPRRGTGGLRARPTSPPRGRSVVRVVPRLAARAAPAQRTRPPSQDRTAVARHRGRTTRTNGTLRSAVRPATLRLPLRRRRRARAPPSRRDGELADAVVHACGTDPELAPFETGRYARRRAFVDVLVLLEGTGALRSIEGRTSPSRTTSERPCSTRSSRPCSSHCSPRPSRLPESMST